MRNIACCYNRNNRDNECYSPRGRSRSCRGLIEKVRFNKNLKELDRWKWQVIELCSLSDFDSKRNIPTALVWNTNRIFLLVKFHAAYFLVYWNYLFWAKFSRHLWNSGCEKCLEKCTSYYLWCISTNIPHIYWFSYPAEFCWKKIIFFCRIWQQEDQK